MNIPSWLEDPALWHTIYFGAAGRALPGLAKVSPKQRNTVQKNAGPGINGGSIVDQGSELSEFEIELRCWTSAQWEDLIDLGNQVLLPSIRPKSAHTVAHPIFAYYKCSQIYIESFSGPDLADGIMTMKLTACRWVKPAKKSVTAKVIADAGTASFDKSGGAGAVGAGSVLRSDQSRFPSPTDSLPPISLKP